MTDRTETETDAAASASARAFRRRLLVPLALTQFIASFAGSNMNVAINNISKDLDTTIHGVKPRSRCSCCVWRP